MFNSGADMSFQPFSHLVDFHKLIKQKKPSFLFLPKWYLDQYKGELKLKVLLEPTRDNSSHYKKVLLTNKKFPITLNSIEKRTLAMTYMGPDGISTLNTLLGLSGVNRINKINLVTVGKDMDALLALALGQVELAFVGKDNIEMVSKVNPRIIKHLKELKESIPIPLPVLCSVNNQTTQADEETFKELFLDKTLQNKRRKIMEMLQLDAWTNLIY